MPSCLFLVSFAYYKVKLTILKNTLVFSEEEANDSITSNQSINDIKIFIVLSESPIKIMKIAVYHFFIFFLIA